MTLVKGDQKASISIATPFPELLHFALDPYLIVLSCKLGGIKYDLKVLCNESTWDWTPVSGLLANTVLIRPMARSNSTVVETYVKKAEVCIKKTDLGTNYAIRIDVPKNPYHNVCEYVSFYPECDTRYIFKCSTTSLN